MHLLPQVTLDQREVKAPNAELAEEEDGKTKAGLHQTIFSWDLLIMSKKHKTIPALLFN